MNKKLMKTRVSRTNTLEAMITTCGCICAACVCSDDCSKCSAGGSFQAIERVNRRDDKLRVRTDASTYSSRSQSYL